MLVRKTVCLAFSKPQKPDREGRYRSCETGRDFHPLDGVGERDLTDWSGRFLAASVLRRPHIVEFLFSMLRDVACRPYIRWTSAGGAFKVCNPAEVARRWGLTKGSANMTYEKMSRGIRWARVRIPGALFFFVCLILRVEISRLEKRPSYVFSNYLLWCQI